MSAKVYSMTAFARLQENINSKDFVGQFAWEIRSVNQRYLEINFRMNDRFRYLETAIRNQIKKSLARGKIDLSLSIELNDTQNELPINKELVSALNKAVYQIEKQLANPAKTQPLDILKWPGVLEPQNPQIDQETETQLLQTLDKAIDQLKANRLREGMALKAVIEERCSQIEQQIELAEAILPEIRDSHLQKLHAKLQHFQENLDEQRLHIEAAILMQKMDIDEEIKRLHTHLAEVRHVINQNQPIGRRLDFLMQELNREANTLGSKSIDARTSQISVELKVLIEQMREQVQNIE